MSQVLTEDIVASDGFVLSATTYRPSRAASLAVVVAGATGVPQGFYRRFAEFCTDEGFEVITFDYRGIGRSRRGPLRGFEATFLDWAQKDLAAVVDWSLARCPTLVVGHSFGGHAFGLLARANDTIGLYTFGTGAGWHGHMPVLEQPKVVFLWNVVGPLLASRYGYLPSKRLGIGEDLPLGVYRQWKHWCRYPNYWFGDPALDFAERFARVRRPIVAVNALDDRWAPPRSRDAFMKGYCLASLEVRDEAPTLGAIGHMGYFRPSSGIRLWRELATWLLSGSQGGPVASGGRD